MKLEFEGAVTCRRENGAINLVLAGRERHACGIAALFAQAASARLGDLPRTLHEVQLTEHAATADGATRRFQLLATELQMELTARSVQLHREAAREFFGAVPPPRVPLGRRVGWTLLLLALRIPGVEALLVRLRARA
jgi:hypothetical protein